jgi:hypothetical protein|nr:MAG TPA: hypothetical protein [Caudoviricetes sp.]
MAKGRKTGGRKPGSLNKTTKVSREMIVGVLEKYQESGMMSEDLEALEPKDRIDIMVKLMNFVLPKMQSAQVDLTANVKEVSVESDLTKLAEEMA